MKNLLTLITLLTVACGADIAWGEDTLFGQNTKILSLDEFSVEYFQYQARRDAYYPDYKTEGHWVGGSRVNYTLGIMRGLYMSNTLHFSYDNTPQVREGGWIYEAGVRVFKWLDVYKWHHSRHGMEYKHPDGLKFPVTDTYGVRFNLIK